jgi:hypothetical protein
MRYVFQIPLNLFVIAGDGVRVTAKPSRIRATADRAGERCRNPSRPLIHRAFSRSP